MSTGSPPPPVEHEPSSPPNPPELVQLWRDVRDTLHALPAHFSSTLVLEGIAATDLFTFAASLGATIEQQVVDHLNRLRQTTWDADGRFALYSFERQPQRFPDVVLKTSAPGQATDPLLGIELKGWYALAKEGEPSFRYVVNPAVPTEVDLLAVFPWALSNVVSGSPFLYAPYVVGARFAAEYRNWHWQHARKTTGDASIVPAVHVSHYPLKSDAIADKPSKDQGGNFGRFARTTLMDQFTASLDRQMLSGIPIGAWRRFLKVFTESAPSQAVDRLLDQIEREQDPLLAALDAERRQRLRLVLHQLVELFEQRSE